MLDRQTQSGKTLLHVQSLLAPSQPSSWVDPDATYDWSLPLVLPSGTDFGADSGGVGLYSLPDAGVRIGTLGPAVHSSVSSFLPVVRMKNANLAQDGESSRCQILVPQSRIKPIHWQPGLRDDMIDVFFMVDADGPASVSSDLIRLTVREIVRASSRDTAGRLNATQSHAFGYALYNHGDHNNRESYEIEATHWIDPHSDVVRFLSFVPSVPARFRGPQVRGFRNAELICDRIRWRHMSQRIIVIVTDAGTDLSAIEAHARAIGVHPISIPIADETQLVSDQQRRTVADAIHRQIEGIRSAQRIKAVWCNRSDLKLWVWLSTAEFQTLSTELRSIFEKPAQSRWLSMPKSLTLAEWLVEQNLPSFPDLQIGQQEVLARSAKTKLTAEVVQELLRAARSQGHFTIMPLSLQ